MASLIDLSIKTSDGTFKYYTVSISDETDKYGNNVAMYVAQTKEQREAKEKRTYVGNGKVFWTDGTIKKAKRTTTKRQDSLIQLIT